MNELSEVLAGEGLAESVSEDAWSFSLDRRAEAIAKAVWYTTQKPQDESAWECSNVQHVADRCLYGTPSDSSQGKFTDWQTTQVICLRCIIGPLPFRPNPIDPRWLSSTVVDLARTIYQERAFDRMPILVDALMDAGCDYEEIIEHCRGDGPHVRGCWVVDYLLAKE